MRKIKLYRWMVRPLPFLLLIALLPMGGLSFFVYYYTNSNSEKEISALSIQSMYKTRDAMDTVFREIDRLAAQLSLEESIRYFMLTPDAESLTNEQYKSINRTMSMFTLIYDYIDSIYLYSDASHHVATTEWRGDVANFLDREWFDAYALHKDTDLDRWYQSRKLRTEDGDYPYLITLSRPVKLYPPQSVGLVVINIDVQKLGRLMGNIDLESSRDFFITDKAGIIYYNSDLNLISHSIHELGMVNTEVMQQTDYSKVIRRDKSRLTLTAVDSTGFAWRYISLVPLEFDKEKNAGLLRFAIIFIFLYVGASLLISGGLKMVESKRRIREKLTLNRLLLDKAQAQALQSQINPHFLHNTLETIRIMVIKATGTLHSPAETMLTSLSEMLRISMEGREHLIALADEVSHSQRYLEIVKVRYGDKFAVEWDIPEEIRDCRVMKLSLQPLIENAIEHGIKPMRRKGIVRITGRLRGEHLVLEVKDDGLGMSQEQAEKRNERLKAVDSRYELQDSQLGMANVNQRIKLIFGEPYGLSIASAPGVGTTVTMTCPNL